MPGKKMPRDEVEYLRRRLCVVPSDQAVRLLAHVDYLHDVLRWYAEAVPPSKRSGNDYARRAREALA